MPRLSTSHGVRRVGRLRRRLAGGRGPAHRAGPPPRTSTSCTPTRSTPGTGGPRRARSVVPHVVHAREIVVQSRRCAARRAGVVPALRDPRDRGVVRGRRAARSRERRRARRVPRPRRVLARATPARSAPASASPTTSRWSARSRGSIRSRASTCCSTRFAIARAAASRPAARDRRAARCSVRTRYAADLRGRVSPPRPARSSSSRATTSPTSWPISTCSRSRRWSRSRTGWCWSRRWPAAPRSVATDHGGPPEIVARATPGTGRVVPPGDADALAAALLELLPAADVAGTPAGPPARPSHPRRPRFAELFRSTRRPVRPRP